MVNKKILFMLFKKFSDSRIVAVIFYLTFYLTLLCSFLLVLYFIGNFIVDLYNLSQAPITSAIASLLHNLEQKSYLIQYLAQVLWKIFLGMLFLAVAQKVVLEFFDISISNGVVEKI